MAQRPPEAALKTRLRIVSQQTEDGWRWYATLIDRDENELARSPAGTEVEAERYMENYRRYGAWERS